LARPSVWGLLVIILALAMWLFSTWPFNYAYPRRLAMVPAVAGAVLAVGGWRVLKLCLPMLLILMIAIPTGSRYYAFLIIKPEQYTLEAVRGTLDLLPGVFANLNGLDLSYTHGSHAGMIAMGEPVRGASLLLSFLTIGVFVTFARIRPFWQIVVMVIAGAPVVLFCNYARLLIFGLVTIYGRTEPLSFAPRVTAVVLSLLLAYGLSVLLLWVLGKIIIDETGLEGRPGVVSPAHA
jgi:exosortase/archaeosortase family protein